MNRKGIILAGGKGTRLHPLTQAVSKQLLPVYDKPMIYYPISVLMLAGIREYLIISTEESLPLYKSLLGDGSSFGISIEYCVQKNPNGLPEAFVLAENFLSGAPSALALGDNLLFGFGLGDRLKPFVSEKEGMSVLAYPVHNPSDYGIVELDSENKVISLEEKPKSPKSNLAIPGFYFCDKYASLYAKNLIPSPRREVEIIDLMKKYLSLNQLKVQNLGRGFAWLDTGSPDALLDASNFVATVERRQGLKIACLEEIGYKNGWVSKENIQKNLKNLPNTPYNQYLDKVLQK